MSPVWVSEEPYYFYTVFQFSLNEPIQYKQDFKKAYDEDITGFLHYQL